MVLQQRLDAERDQTLAALWRTHAERLDRRAIALCILLGTLGTTSPAFLPRATFLSLVSFIVATFGAYAAIAQPSLGGRWLSPRAQRIVGVSLSAVAGMAGLAAGLLILGTVFGGSIEVMRR